MIFMKIRRKLLPNTEKVFRYSVKMHWLYRKTFLFGYQYRITFFFGIQYRKSFSVIYADTANRKRVYAWWRVPFKYNRKTFSVNELCVHWCYLNYISSINVHIKTTNLNSPNAEYFFCQMDVFFNRSIKVNSQISNEIHV